MFSSMLFYLVVPSYMQVIILVSCPCTVSGACMAVFLTDKLSRLVTPSHVEVVMVHDIFYLVASVMASTAMLSYGYTNTQVNTTSLLRKHSMRKSTRTTWLLHASVLTAIS